MRENIDGGPSKLVLKYGSGRHITEHDILVVHLRAAKRIEDLQDDARVLCSTYTSGVAITVEYRQDNLLPEVYESLADLFAGSTVVIKLRRSYAVSVNDGLCLEVWIQEVRSPGAPTAETLATRDLLRDATPVNTLLAACRDARVQPNGRVLPVAASMRTDFLAICASIAKGIQGGQPKKLGSDSGNPGAVTHFLISEGLYVKLVSTLEGKA
ncbi:hypothetical protein ACFFQW_03005 [Umezawaea endophytica]|uniref:Uncharacterized protein n=1 Tax=Umezawaea endophytica TaxID=1654476 RepID=A0A9X3AH82_9PSEU|nr:hypothetical protein [Umezawaea endophytica]MCS7479115.1 hypothetical protein [Umezawaea endophytica]